MVTAALRAREMGTGVRRAQVNPDVGLSILGDSVGPQPGPCRTRCVGTISPLGLHFLLGL